MEKCVALVKDGNKNVFYNVKIKMLKTGFGCLKKGESIFASYSAGLFLKIRRAKKVPWKGTILSIAGNYNKQFLTPRVIFCIVVMRVIFYMK